MIFAYDRELVYPATIDTFFPPWMNHAMVCKLLLFFAFFNVSLLMVTYCSTVFSAHTRPACFTWWSAGAASHLPTDPACTCSIRSCGLVLLILVSDESADLWEEFPIRTNKNKVNTEISHNFKTMTCFFFIWIWHNAAQSIELWLYCQCLVRFSVHHFTAKQLEGKNFQIIVVHTLWLLPLDPHMSPCTDNKHTICWGWGFFIHVFMLKMLISNISAKGKKQCASGYLYNTYLIFQTRQYKIIWLLLFLSLQTRSAGLYGCTCQLGSGCILCWATSALLGWWASSFSTCLWWPCSTCLETSSTLVCGVSDINKITRLGTNNWTQANLPFNLSFSFPVLLFFHCLLYSR